MGKMKLSTVFELLLIFLFIAFAASRNLGETKVKVLRKEENNTKPATPPALGSCKCATLQCNCCRHFSLPLVSVKGPGCASITYLNGNSLRLTMSFGDRVLRNITLAGKKPNPVCMSLPGGVSKFCGRIYGIQREGDHFRSCLALELRALDDIEAALRVSCFTFGPQGVRLEPARPLPASRPDDEDDEDDEDDDYGLDEDSDFGLDDDEEDDTENDVDSSEIDYTGFSALSDEFLESFFESSGSKKKQTYTQHKVTAPTIVLAENPTKLQDIKETLIPITAPSTSEMPDYTTQNPTIAESQQKADKNNLNSTDGQTQGSESSEEAQLEDTHNQTDHKLDIVKEEENSHDNDDNMEEPLQIQDSKTTQQPSVNDNNTDEFRQLRSYVPRTAMAPITLAEQEQRFPGLSALIKRQAHHKIVYDDVISQWHSPINQPTSGMSFDFPPARSARNHKKMRFPLDS